MNDQFRQTDVGLSALAWHLLGNTKNYRLMRQRHTLIEATHLYKRMYKNIRTTLGRNISVIDRAHKRAILHLIEKADASLDNSNSFETLDQTMISYQYNLIMMLIGNGHRQIQFVQDVNNKAQVILAAVQDQYKERFGPWQEFLTDIYVGQCNHEPEKLVEMIRVKHPDIYSDLF